MKKLFVLIMFILFSSNTLAQTKLLNIQYWTTKNGLDVYFVKAPQLPMVDIRLTFHAGSARDGAQFGLAYLTNKMLSEGAENLTAQQINMGFENLGAVFTTQSGRDMAVISLRTLTMAPNLEKALSVFDKIIAHPTFPPSALSRKKNNILTAIKAQKQNPGSIASEKFYKTIYGNSPYGHPILGTPQTVKKITQDDLAKFYKTYYVAKNGVLAITGDLTKVQAEQISEKISQHLQTGEKAVSIPNPENIKNTNQTISFPSSQTHILLGQLGISRTNPDYYALYIGNYIFGGSGFVSTLYQHIREKNGLAYSVYSYFFPMSSKGTFIIGLQTKNNQTQKAIDIIKKLLNNFVESGPTQKQINLAKKAIINGYPLRFDSNKDINTAISILGFYHLPMDYYNNFTKNIKNVTKEQIKTAFKKFIHPNQLTLITVGGHAKKTKTPKPTTQPA